MSRCLPSTFHRRSGAHNKQRISPRQVARREVRVDKGEQDAALVRAVRTACWLSYSTSVLRLPLGSTSREMAAWRRQLQRYVLLWVSLLFLLLMVASWIGQWRWILLIFALYRLQAILLSSVDDAFQLTSRSAQFRGADPSGTQAILVVLVNIVQIIVIFAISYMTLGGSGGFVPHDPRHLSGGFDFLYVSWTTISTLGSGFSPATPTVRVLTMAETGIGFIMVALALTSFLSRRSDQPDRVGHGLRGWRHGLKCPAHLHRQIHQRRRNRPVRERHRWRDSHRR
jgi:hypothetical protein